MATYEVTIQGQMIEVDANSEAEARIKAVERFLASSSPWSVDDYENELLRSITHVAKKE